MSKDQPLPSLGVKNNASLIPSRLSHTIITPKSEPNNDFDEEINPLFSARPPDETCHHRPFFSSVIKVPYVTFDRVVYHSIKTEGVKSVPKNITKVLKGEKGRGFTNINPFTPFFQAPI